MQQRSRVLRRVLVPVAALGLALGAAGTAAAHVEVDSSTAQALAVGAEVSFSAEGESSTAGITDVKVALPAGLAPADVTLVKAPTGWTLTATADGYAVAGPALAPGTAAEYTVKVRQLPDAASVVFKTLVDYSDGHTDRWIELPQGDTKPAHPAPVLALRPAAAGATPLAPAAAGPSPSASATPSPSAAAPSTPAVTTASAAPAAKKDDGGTSTTAIVLGSLAGLAVLGTLVALALRRRPSR
ncbi:DUF1775 domain-containing protein [Streptomyces sp. TLI_171]|uniref:DUF1775 domain-containing protein n=1 Tax=Streptomyces sp. TLI_171 TaxID=1938859 RepID=UPI000C1A1F78|nr:DUF1775 domain-containing protein [Streptomyces sp. TLI_171]RKE18206.1 uncharacterized protein DUF1775 [Streptomyces sp. TLI_171]